MKNDLCKVDYYFDFTAQVLIQGRVCCLFYTSCFMRTQVVCGKTFRHWILVPTQFTSVFWPGSAIITIKNLHCHYILV